MLSSEVPSVCRSAGIASAISLPSGENETLHPLPYVLMFLNRFRGDWGRETNQKATLMLRRSQRQTVLSIPREVKT